MKHYALPLLEAVPEDNVRRGELLELIDAVQAGIDTSLLPVYLVGMLVAGVVGYFAIRLVNLLAGKGKFGAFAYYCWAAGAISLAASLAGL